MQCLTWFGFFCGLMDVALLLVLWLGGWSIATEGARIMYLALLGSGFPLGMLAVLLALAVGGPVGRYKAAAGRRGIEFELEAPDDHPEKKV